jgi:hypothetical protein
MLTVDATLLNLVISVLRYLAFGGHRGAAHCLKVLSVDDRGDRTTGHWHEAFSDLPN